MNIDQVIAGFDRRYRTKKILNIAISALIVLCGIFSVYFIFKFDTYAYGSPPIRVWVIFKVFRL